MTARRTRPTDRPCPKCGETDSNKFYGANSTYCKTCANAYTLAWQQAHPEKRNQWAKNWRSSEKCQILETLRRQNMRARCIEKLGGKCAWPEGCDWTDPRALQIDHKRGGGNKERKELNGARAFYKRVLADENDTYQLLCANHNAIKKIVNGEYHSKHRSTTSPNDAFPPSSTP